MKGFRHDLLILLSALTKVSIRVNGLDEKFAEFRFRFDSGNGIRE